MRRNSDCENAECFLEEQREIFFSAWGLGRSPIQNPAVDLRAIFGRSLKNEHLPEGRCFEKTPENRQRPEAGGQIVEFEPKGENNHNPPATLGERERGKRRPTGGFFPSRKVRRSEDFVSRASRKLANWRFSGSLSATRKMNANANFRACNSSTAAFLFLFFLFFSRRSRNGRKKGIRSLNSAFCDVAFRSKNAEHVEQGEAFFVSEKLHVAKCQVERGFSQNLYPQDFKGDFVKTPLPYPFLSLLKRKV